MSNFYLKSAKEVLAMVQENPALLNEALAYAKDKAEKLQVKGKTLRSKLWLRAIAGMVQDASGGVPAENTDAEADQSAPNSEAEYVAAVCDGVQRRTEEYIARYKAYWESHDARCKARGMVKKKTSTGTMWVYPTEFWTFTGQGFKLTEQNAERGRAMVAA